MEKVRLTYVGRYSRFSCGDGGFGVVNQQRGEPFECPREWADARIKEDPASWKLEGGSSAGKKPKKEVERNGETRTRV